MKRILILLATLSLCPILSFAQDTITEKGYDHTGAYVERLVDIPQGATADTYQSSLIAPEEYHKALSQPERKAVKQYAIVPHGTGAGLVVQIRFAEFSELLNPIPAPEYYMTAQNGGAVALPPQDEKGIVESTMDFTKANPWLVGGLLFVTLDFLEGDGIDAFGLFGGGDSGSGRPTVQVSGENNTVTITDNTNSGNDSSNRPATAAPFFPPVSAGE